MWFSINLLENKALSYYLSKVKLMPEEETLESVVITNPLISDSVLDSE